MTTAVAAVAQVMAQVLAIANQWNYVTASYGLVVGVLAAYAAWTIVRGRKVGRQLPPEDRRWM